MTDLTPNDLSHLSDEEFNALCPQGHHAPGPAQPLSPAAQAVLNAAFLAYDDETLYVATCEQHAGKIAAAALRAAADQVVPEKVNPVGDEHDDARHDQWIRIRLKFLAIAAELEADR